MFILRIEDLENLKKIRSNIFIPDRMLSGGDSYYVDEYIDKEGRGIQVNLLAKEYRFTQIPPENTIKALPYCNWVQF